jgi:hypothetical protein
MKRLPLFVFVLGLCSLAVGQDDLRTAYRKGLYGYIDRSGDWVIEPRFVEASGWEGGAARVSLPGGYYSFIGSNGKYLMQPRRFERLEYLSEGLAAFEPEVMHRTAGFINKVGFLDTTGHVVITPRFIGANDFSEGVAAASVEFDSCGYIDRQGNFVIEPAFEFSSCGSFSEGLARVAKAGKSGYIDHTGSFVISPIYDYAYEFSEGYAVVGIRSRYIFINKSGTPLGTSSYSFARSFSEGLAAVAADHNWGFIDKAGTLAIPAKYEEVGDFSEGLAWVQIDRKRGYIDVHGNLVVAPKYDQAFDFWNGMAEVLNGQTPEGDPEVRKIIDTSGTPVTLRKK